MLTIIRFISPFFPKNSSIEKSKVILENCISDIRNYFLSNWLKINDSKTEIILIGTPKQVSKVENISI